VKRGEVHWARLVTRSGSEQQGDRPVVIVSTDAFNGAPGWRSLIVVPISSSSSQRRRGPTAVPLPKGTGGLAEDSVALCHQVTTLDRSKLTRPMGALPGALLDAVAEGLKVALDLR
jgi:mRNA interferase MazF